MIPKFMKVSILIPTYKRPEFLKQCIQSCIRQTLKPCEILIGDDYPGEDTLTAINSFEVDFPIIHNRNKPSLGQAKNVDSLIQLACGDLCCLIHDDDLLEPDALENLARVFTKDNDVIFSFGKQYVISNDGDLKEQESLDLNAAYCRSSDRAGIQPDILKAALLQQMPNNGYLVRSDYAKEIGYADHSYDYGDACDFGFCLELALKYSHKKVLFVDEFVSSYRESDISIARTKSTNDCMFRSFCLQYSYGKLIYELDPDMNRALEAKIPGAIANAIQRGELLTASRWMMSRYHWKRLLSLGGIKRFLMLINASFALNK